MQRMLTAVVSGVLLGPSAGLTPGPMLALVLAQTLLHGSREGCKVALTPLITDPPIIIVVLAIAAKLAQSWLVAVTFLFGFYLLPVGSKVVIALLAGRSRNLMVGRAYQVIMRVLAVVLAAFAVLLLNEGLRQLAVL
jgi:threonine/homoserine/homoserine lactone efflux protein